MNVTKYKIKSNMIVLDVLFLVDDIVYIEHYDPVNGRPQRVFKEDKTLLGTITSKSYWNIEKHIEKI